jgi:hypothetical protein
VEQHRPPPAPSPSPPHQASLPPQPNSFVKKNYITYGGTTFCIKDLPPQSNNFEKTIVISFANRTPPRMSGLQSPKMSRSSPPSPSPPSRNYAEALLLLLRRQVLRRGSLRARPPFLLFLTAPLRHVRQSPPPPSRWPGSHQGSLLTPLLWYIAMSMVEC